MHTPSKLHPAAFELLALAVFAFVTAGCHRIALTPQEEAVRVLRDAAQVAGCQFVKDVESSDRLSGGLTNREKAEENAYKILKQKTAKLGANTVVLSTASSGYAGAGMKGKAYSCRSG